MVVVVLVVAVLVVVRLSRNRVGSGSGSGSSDTRWSCSPEYFHVHIFGISFKSIGGMATLSF